MLVVAAGLSLSVSLAASEPCLVPLDDDAESPTVLVPQDGAADVATTARVVMEDRGTPTILETDAGLVATTTEAIDIDHGFSPLLRLNVLVPTAPLPSKSTVRIVADGAVLGTFSVGDGDDLTPPAAPGLSVRGPGSYGACRRPAVDLAVFSDEDTAFLIARHGDEVSVDGFTIGRVLAVQGEAHETRDVVVTAVDASGNASPPTSIEVTFPAAFGGCASTSTGDGVLSMLAGLVGFCARRRRS